MPRKKSTVTDGAAAAATLALAARPERHLVPPCGGVRRIDCRIQVEKRSSTPGKERAPLTLALVLDRSGSMARGKLETAKQAALAVLEKLDERDQVAVVIYDDRIDLLQPLTAVTPGVRSAVRTALARVQPRGSTALYEGWLTGCRAIAADGSAPEGTLRCFLLTDGLANVGPTDPEEIATCAARVREHGQVGTSTFGIGADYDEGLLGPMAVAGGGQFHHLRKPEEIATTFVNELGEMLAIAAGRVRLELELPPGVSAEVVSAYWLSELEGGGVAVDVGDLLGGEERHVVVALNLPPGKVGDAQTVRVRAMWIDGAAPQAGGWSELPLRYATPAECDAEPYDAEVIRWAGLHEAERAKNESIALNRRGDLEGARARLERTRQVYYALAVDDSVLQDKLQEIEFMAAEVAAAPMDAMRAKEERARAWRESRMQRDLRGEEKKEGGDVDQAKQE